MPPQILFGASVAFGFIAWTIVRYMWPYLRARTRAEALRPLLLLHGFRFVGLSFMIPGVVAPGGYGRCASRLRRESRVPLQGLD
jgi:hypothetical protein